MTNNTSIKADATINVGSPREIDLADRVRSRILDAARAVAKKGKDDRAKTAIGKAAEDWIAEQDAKAAGRSDYWILRKDSLSMSDEQIQKGWDLVREILPFARKYL